jgi:hypothetical protein
MTQRQRRNSFGDCATASRYISASSKLVFPAYSNATGRAWLERKPLSPTRTLPQCTDAPPTKSTLGGAGITLSFRFAHRTTSMTSMLSQACRPHVQPSSGTST